MEFGRLTRNTIVRDQLGQYNREPGTLNRSTYVRFRMEHPDSGKR